MSLEIRRWTGPPVDTHTYLVSDAAAREAWVFDAPLDTAGQVLEVVASTGLQLTRLVLTHAHFDHLLDAGRYAAAGVPISLHPADRDLLAIPQPEMFGLSHTMPAFPVSEDLREGQRLTLGSTEWVVWHVPGHSPGHVALYSSGPGVLVGGDLVFHDGYGRVDLPASDPGAMEGSLRRLLTLPDSTTVLPGHGPETTIGAERGWLADLLSQGPG